MNLRLSVLPALIALFSLLFPPLANAQKLILYMDTITKQVYAEPGENRIKLGVFQQVEEEVTTAQPESNTPATRHVESHTTKNAEQHTTAAQPEQAAKVTESSTEKSVAEKKWYDRVDVKGYTQFRYSRSLWGDKNDISYWQDRSVDPDNSFLIKKARLELFGDVTDYLSVKFQTDLVSTPSGSTSTHFLQLKDAYADIFFDKKKEFWVRVGQSKVPYSFEKLQSSAQRLALDESDVLSSCCGRDIGAFFYWTPGYIHDRFKTIKAQNLKGASDYGVVALGVYSGQGANHLEMNDSVHLVGRLTYPFQFENGQFFEAGVQAIHGRYVPSVGLNAYGFTPTLDAPKKGFKDQHVGVHAILYPQPFGLQAEWNWARGPRLNESQTMLEDTSFNGGYVQAMYKVDKFFWGTLFPFVRWQYFDGALMLERNTPKDRVKDLELGLEWQILPEIEITAAYHMMNRTNTKSASYERFKTDVLRFQLQWSYF